MFGGMVPMDRESLKVVSAYNYLKLREEEEIEKIGKGYSPCPSPIESKEKIKRIEEVHATFRRKERELFRRASGPLAKIIDG